MICIAAVARRAAIRAVLAAVLLAASAACSPSSADRGNAGAANTVRTEPPPPAPTTTTNPYAVPAVIDVAYVNRVLAGLDAAMGDTLRIVIQTKTIPREAYDRLRAIYGHDAWFQSSLDSFQTDMRRNFSTYLPAPGNKVTTVSQLISATKNCIFARVTRDYSKVAAQTSPPETQWIALHPLNRLHDSKGYNVTGWALAYDGYSPNRQPPPDPCQS